MLCTTGAKTALDTCCPASEKNYLLVDERGQPFRHWIKQWVRSIERVSSIGLKIPGPSSVSPQNHATVLATRQWECTLLHAAGRAKTSFQRYRSEAGPRITPLYRSEWVPSGVLRCCSGAQKCGSEAQKEEKAKGMGRQPELAR